MIINLTQFICLFIADGYGHKYISISNKPPFKEAPANSIM